MRRGLLFALMVMLVLRGLAGTAMAAGMWHAAPAAIPAATAVVEAPHQGHPAHFAATLQPLPTVAEAAGQSDHSHHGSELEAAQPCSETPAADCAGHEHSQGNCTACDICHSAMLEAPMLHAPAEAPASFALPGGTARFASAPAALAIKPPIA